MPFQNRVDPFSRLHVHPARGLFTGNRGCMHDLSGALTTTTWRDDAWITCVLEFRDRKRVVMAPNQYTHLFFLDEATAMAAGHRPCFECRYADAKAYCRAVEKWTGTRPMAPDINRAILEEMSAVIRGGPHEHVEAERMPEGAMVALDGVAYLVLATGLRRWSFDGYGRLEAFPQRPVMRLTPRMSIAALEGGYRPVMAVAEDA